MRAIVIMTNGTDQAWPAMRLMLMQPDIELLQHDASCA